MKKNQITRNVLAAMGFLAIAAMTVMGCQKKGKDREALRSATAGTLPLTCADTMSVPKDGHDIITISTLTNDKIWKLNGINYITAGRTLTIEPGTKIVTGAKRQYNDPTHGPQSLAGILAVGRGGKLIADGKLPHADSTIVFTTLKQLGICESGCDMAGEGPSIVMVGSAQTNRTTTTFIPGVPVPLGFDFAYGPGYTINNADNSGILRYVRIEFPGYFLSSSSATNGLILAGVGTGTVISHVQVSYSKNDAFGFFGGTVNCDHLVAIGADNDDYDFEHGYTGIIDYAIGLKDPGSTHSDCNGIEADNDGTGTTAAPLTKPVLRHFTVLGYANNSNPTHLLRGARFRRTTALDVEYSIFGGFPVGAEFSSISNPTSVISNFSHNVIQGYADTVIASFGLPNRYIGNIALAASANANNFLFLGPNAFAQPFFSCSSTTSYNPAHLVPRITSPAYGNGTTTYKGAFQPGVALWTADWTNFNLDFCCIN